MTNWSLKSFDNHELLFMLVREAFKNQKYGINEFQTIDKFLAWYFLLLTLTGIFRGPPTCFYCLLHFTVVLSTVVQSPNPRFSIVVELPNPKMNTVVRLPKSKLSTAVRLPNPKLSAVVWLTNLRFSTVVWLHNPKLSTVVGLPNPKKTTVIQLPQPVSSTVAWVL